MNTAWGWANVRTDLEDFVNTSSIANHTASTSTWPLIDSWIARCNDDHDCCTAATKSLTKLPNRIIDIQNETSFRLVTTDSSTSLGRYVTLSHCWGSEVPLRLLTNNIETFRNHIPPSDLSQTFEDAILIARRLNVRYIWIDSLCIIQDSPQDWQEQSATMAQVYSDSYCNIAATHARDGSFGCFNKRDAGLIKPLKICVQWGPQPGWYYAVPGRYWIDTVAEAPLSLRGWAFQELTLAPRNLFFGQSEVLFRCWKMGASEMFPIHIPREVGVGGLRGVQPNLDGPQVRKWYDIPADERLNALSLWDDMVRTFSLGGLTFATDKLVALSAIATMLSRYIRSQYLAGLWRRHLAHQLLWEVRGVIGIVKQCRTSTYVAPTWSWASVTGKVEQACRIPYADDRDIVVEILDAQVELVSSLSPFGQVKNGFARIKGPLAKGKKAWRWKTQPKDFPQILIGEDIWLDVIWDDGEVEKEDDGSEDLYCLPIQFMSSDDEPIPLDSFRSQWPAISGIVLRTQSDVDQTYVRAGKFEFREDCNRFQAACRDFGGELKRGLDTGDEWGEMHELTII